MHREPGTPLSDRNVRSAIWGLRRASARQLFGPHQRQSPSSEATSGQSFNTVNSTPGGGATETVQTGRSTRSVAGAPVLSQNLSEPKNQLPGCFAILTVI